MRRISSLLLFLIMTIAGCGGAKADPESRTIAQWVIGMGGTVSYDGRLSATSRLDELPSRPFVLNKVVLNKTAVKNDDLKKLTELTDLTHLELHETNISDEGLDHVAKIATLTELELSYTQISDAGLRKLKQLPKLKKLYLTGTDVTDAAIEEFRKDRKGCDVIHLP